MSEDLNVFINLLWLVSKSISMFTAWEKFIIYMVKILEQLWFAFQCFLVAKKKHDMHD